MKTSKQIFGCLNLICILFIGFSNGNPFKVTFPGFGTFTTKDFHHPILRPIVRLPDHPDKLHTIFGLYTRQNPLIPDFLDWKSPNYYDLSHFNPNLDTKILVHGLARHFFDEWMQLAKDNYIHKYNHNVIIVGWTKGAVGGYAKTISNARVVGIQIGKVIENLVKHYNVSLDSFHLVGHSLGAQTVGHAGKYLKGRVGRITGLDPAGPSYDFMNDTRARLWHTDAKFVDVIHTCSLPTWAGSGGSVESIGHVDIFPNGGATQNGCIDQFKAAIKIPIVGLLAGPILRNACEHYRSGLYFLESFDPPISDPVAHSCRTIKAFENGECNQCDPKKSNCVIMDPVARNYPYINRTQTQGKRFFMRTASSPPFMRYQISARIKFKKPKEFNGFNKLDLLLTFVDHQGRKDRFDFSRYMQKVSKDEFVNFFVSDIDPEQLKDIRIEFRKRGRVLPLEAKVINEYIDHVTYTALSFKSGSKRMKPLTYVKRPLSKQLHKV